MLNPDTNDKATAVAFDFFYWFSRFEFALKENGWLHSSRSGETAMPGWNRLTQKLGAQYVLTNAARNLVQCAPRVQIVGPNGHTDWRDLEFKDATQLQIVVVVLKTIRNNLFHGGKSGAKGWKDPHRLIELITSAKAVLDELAKLSDLEADYYGIY